MPRVTLWIREDDFEAYLAIPDKPEWLHEAIQAEADSKPTIDVAFDDNLAED